MWISEPTPVISSTNAAESGSYSSPASTCSVPAETNVKRSSDTAWVLVAASWTVPISPMTKATSTVPVPSRWPQRSVRRPPSSSTAAPASGSAMNSQEAASSPSAGRVSGTAGLRHGGSPGWSVLEQVRVVDRGGPAGPGDRQDDGQAGDGPRRRDDHDEEGDDLAVDGPAGPGEGHQGEVDRVEHQLDAHEDDDRVAPHQHPAGPDGEKDRRQHQVVRQGHDASVGWPGPVPPGTALGVPSRVPRASSGLPSSCPPDGRGSWSMVCGSIPVAKLASARRPSGSRARAATELPRAYTPGPGSVCGRSVRNRAFDRSFWLRRAPGSRSMCASTIAPTAAVISSALVTSKASRYFVKSSSAIAGMLPAPPFAFSPVAVRSWVARAMPAPTRPAKPMPRMIAATRWPRSVSTTESEESRPTIISTNRNKIMIAPV